MKKAIIIEDEAIAAKHLMQLLAQISPKLEVTKIMQSTKECISYFKENKNADIVFMDIHLSDGSAFHIFEQVEIECPIIFTTAYDEYALEAFKVNSVDYLLKPIKLHDLERSLIKIENLTKNADKISLNTETMNGLLEMMKQNKPKYKAHFLIPQGEKLIPLSVKDIAYFYIDMKVTHAVTFKNETLALDKSLDDIIKTLDPEKYYRVNRQYIININAIEKINIWLNNKLTITLIIPTPDRIVIPKAKTVEFKDWYTK